MVVLNKIYTRTGDDGTTALASGQRVRKDSVRVAAYGTIDETNAAIGMARVHLAGSHPGLVEKLARIQNDLFDLGAELSTPDTGKPRTRERMEITPAQVKRLEDDIDELNAHLQPLRSFVLPGGSPGAAALHMARTICRRAERLMVTMAADPNEGVSQVALQYVNRLSDLLFVASRYVNDRGNSDILWVPGQNR